MASAQYLISNMYGLASFSGGVTAGFSCSLVREAMVGVSAQEDYELDTLTGKITGAVHAGLILIRLRDYNS
jgi:hypothetical protein